MSDSQSTASFSSKSAGQRLYEQALHQHQKKRENENRQEAHMHRPKSSLSLRDSLANESKKNNGCERLYALSTAKQMEGKVRREEIMRSNLPPPAPFFKTMPLSQATDMYDRSMIHLIHKEMKLMDAAHEREETYKSILIPDSGNE
jgi:hypothetical protein